MNKKVSPSCRATAIDIKIMRDISFSNTVRSPLSSRRIVKTPVAKSTIDTIANVNPVRLPKISEITVSASRAAVHGILQTAITENNPEALILP